MKQMNKGLSSPSSTFMNLEIICLMKTKLLWVLMSIWLSIYCCIARILHFSFKQLTLQLVNLHLKKIGVSQVKWGFSTVLKMYHSLLFLSFISWLPVESVCFTMLKVLNYLKKSKQKNHMQTLNHLRTKHSATDLNSTLLQWLRQIFAFMVYFLFLPYFSSALVAES